MEKIGEFSATASLSSMAAKSSKAACLTDGVAHREDLGIDDACKHVQLMKDIETLLRTVYTFFSRSSVKQAAFDDLAAVLESEAVAFRPLNDVRWLSRHFALKAFMRNIPVLTEYCKKQCEENNDPVCNYCVKKLGDTQIRIALIVLDDVVGELAELNRLLQRSNLTAIEALHFVTARIAKLRVRYLGSTVHWNYEVQNLMNDHQDICTASILRFVERVCFHMESRFPENELLDWTLFEIAALSNTTAVDSGETEIFALVERYKHFFTDSTEAASVIAQQYCDFRFLICEKLKSGLMQTFTDVVQYALKDEQFRLLSGLLDICGTFQASSADCERGFSLMNAIKTKSRNRLEADHLDMLMRIKTYQNSGVAVDVDKVYQFWLTHKDRRQKLN